MNAAQSVSDILSDWKIQIKSQRPGHTEQIVCPRCNGGRTREKSLSVTIDADGLGVATNCWRGTCGWKDGARVAGTDRPIERDRPTVKPKPASQAETENRPQWFWDFWAARKIGMNTIKAFGAYAVTRSSKQLGDNHPFIVFPYTLGGDLVNRKYRPFPEKQPQAQDKDALQTLYNVDRLGEDPDEIVWVEGEPDVLAMFECGIPHAVSLKDGAPAKISDNPNADDKRFEALRTHGELLKNARRIVLGGDMDAPGLVLREELARRLGRHRCLVVNWPEGCKDACDVLREHGPEAVLEAVRLAEPYPIEGLQRVKVGTLQALRKQPPPQVMTTGARATDDIQLRFPTEGRLIVVTGWPGSGKTSYIRFVMVHTATDHARRWAVFSPEMQPWEQFAASVAEAYSGLPFWPTKGYASMTDIEIAEAEAWLANRITMLVSDAEDAPPTLEWILDHARAAVLRDGTTDLLIDPWNEIDHARPDNVSETEYTGRCLQRLKAFGMRHGCNIWVICHPAKPLATKDGGKPGVPTAFSISGSAHWFNKADLGLTVHAAGQMSAEVHVWKSRFRRTGRHPSTAILDYDDSCGRYSTPVDAANAPNPQTKIWND